VQSGVAITRMAIKHIVDTHALVWHLEGNPRLGSSAKTIYDEFLWGYGAEVRRYRPEFRWNSTYKRNSTTRGLR
jgi:hypothetical protein